MALTRQQIGMFVAAFIVLLIMTGALDLKALMGALDLKALMGAFGFSKITSEDIEKLLAESNVISNELSAAEEALATAKAAGSTEKIAELEAKIAKLNEDLAAKNTELAEKQAKFAEQNAKEAEKKKQEAGDAAADAADDVKKAEENVDGAKDEEEKAKQDAQEKRNLANTALSEASAAKAAYLDAKAASDASGSEEDFKKTEAAHANWSEKNQLANAAITAADAADLAAEIAQLDTLAAEEQAALAKRAQEIADAKAKRAEEQAAAERQVLIDAAQIDCRSTGKSLAQSFWDTLGIGPARPFVSRSVAGNNKACAVGFEYAKKGDSLSHFSHHPGKALAGNNDALFSNVTREECAEKCMSFTKDGKPCKSFDYINDAKMCAVSLSNDPSYVKSTAGYDYYALTGSPVEMKYKQIEYTYNPEGDEWTAVSIGDIAASSVKARTTAGDAAKVCQQWEDGNYYSCADGAPVGRPCSSGWELCGEGDTLINGV